MNRIGAKPDTTHAESLGGIGLGTQTSSSSSPGRVSVGVSSPTDPRILSSLTGVDAGRERLVALKTRRVVQSSIGVMRDQKKMSRQARAWALAAAILILLAVSPMLWVTVDNLIAGEHLGDPASQLSLWACVACPALIAAVLVAGWWKRRQ